MFHFKKTRLLLLIIPILIIYTLISIHFSNQSYSQFKQQFIKNHTILPPMIFFDVFDIKKYQLWFQYFLNPDNSYNSLSKTLQLTGHVKFLGNFSLYDVQKYPGIRVDFANSPIDCALLCLDSGYSYVATVMGDTDEYLSCFCIQSQIVSNTPRWTKENHLKMLQLFKLHKNLRVEDFLNGKITEPVCLQKEKVFSPRQIKDSEQCVQGCYKSNYSISLDLEPKKGKYTCGCTKLQTTLNFLASEKVGVFCKNTSEKQLLVQAKGIHFTERLLDNCQRMINQDKNNLESQLETVYVGASKNNERLSDWFERLLNVFTDKMREKRVHLFPITDYNQKEQFLTTKTDGTVELAILLVQQNDTTAAKMFQSSFFFNLKSSIRKTNQKASVLVLFEEKLLKGSLPELSRLGRFLSKNYSIVYPDQKLLCSWILFDQFRKVI